MTKVIEEVKAEIYPPWSNSTPVRTFTITTERWTKRKGAKYPKLVRRSIKINAHELHEIHWFMKGEWLKE